MAIRNRNAIPVAIRYANRSRRKVFASSLTAITFCPNSAIAGFCDDDNNDNDEVAEFGSGSGSGSGAIAEFGDSGVAISLFPSGGGGIWLPCS